MPSGVTTLGDSVVLMEDCREVTPDSTRKINMPNETPEKRCKYYYVYTKWQCPREALPDSEKGYCICHERRDDKDEKLFREEVDKVLKGEKADAYHFEGFYFPFEVDFSRFEFKKNTYFREAFFKKSVSFRRVQFSGKDTDFSEARFSGEETDFSEAQFSGDVTDFFRAQFSGEKTDFSWAQFSGEKINFFRTKFSGEKTDFSAAQFSGKETGFSWAKFSGEKTDFKWARFSGNLADFSFAEIQNYLEFSEASFQSRETKLYYLQTDKNSKIIFKYTVFEESNKNNLTKIDLSKCLFEETNLEYCDLSLTPMDWKTKLLNESLPGSSVASATGIKGIFQKLSKPILGLFETSETDKAERFSHAAESYRMLKVNFNKRQDYGRAAICHYREEVCKRKALKWWTPVGVSGISLLAGIAALLRLRREVAKCPRVHRIPVHPVSSGIVLHTVSAHRK